MNRIQGQPFRELLRLLSGLSLRAYRRPWLMATPVLARFLRPEFLRRHFSAAPAPRQGPWTILKRTLQYLRTNLNLAFSFLLQRRAFRKAAASRPLPAGPVVMLDTVVYAQTALAKGTLELVEFPGLAEEAQASGVPVVLAPALYGPLDQGETQRLSALLAKSSTPVATIFDVVSGVDLLRLFCFALFYPLVLLRFLAGLQRNGPEALVRFECINDLPCPVVPTYLRYLYGRGLARAFPRGLTVVSWWENRAGDKMFLRGLRSTGAPVTVIGAQLYVFPDNYLGAYLTEAETTHRIAPDRLLVNGPYYLPAEGLIPASVGPSLRYAKIFRIPLEPASTGKGILVLLGYNTEGMRQCLDVLAKVPWPEDEPLAVRLHPAHPATDWKALLPARAVLADGDLYEHLAQARLVIGSETGTMLEAVACGLPVINLDALGEMSLRDMPGLGRDVIWLPARTPEDVARQIETAQRIPPETRIEYARSYRREFFSEPVPGRLLESFGLNPQEKAP